MARSRLELHEILKDILGSTNVYFQPPPSIRMSYPAIVYGRGSFSDGVKYASNRKYEFKKRYEITYIDPDPDSEIPDRIGELPLCSFQRFFAADNLNHDVYNLFF